MTAEFKKIVDWEDFRRHGHELVDYMADYYKTLENRDVQPSVEPGFLQKLLPVEAPEASEPFDAIMADFNHYIMPGLSHWQHPNFFGYFPSNSSPPAIFAEMLSKMVASMSFSWGSNPSATELEQVMMDWLAKALHLPSFFLSDGHGGGVIQGSASDSTLVSILAARQKAIKEHSCTLDKLRFYCSEQSHSSVLKGLMIAGVAKDAVRIIASDDSTFVVKVAAFQSAVESDVAAGLVPCFASFNLGSTSAGVVDPLPLLGPICQKHGIWMHLDGAYAGSALVCEEYSYMTNGMEYLDSFVTNPHKWLLTNFDCSAMWVKNRSYLFDALSITPEYLRTKEYDSGKVYDYRDWQISLGRTIRSLKLWFVMRYYGLSGLRQHIRSHVLLGKQFLSYVESDPRFEISAPPMLSLVCFRLKGSNEKNEKYYDEFCTNHKYQLTHCKLHNQYVIRFVTGCPQTGIRALLSRPPEPRHVEACWKALQELATKYEGQE